MNTFKFALIVFALCISESFYVLLFPEPTQQTTKSEDITPKVIIPKNVVDYLKTNIQGWTILDTSDYISAWWSLCEKDKIPYFVTADINDDQKADFALLLKNNKSVQLFILMAKGDSFTHWTDENFKEPYNGKVADIQFGLDIERPGHTDCVVDGKECSLKLKSNGFSLTVLERKGIIYYWNDGKIKSFRVISKLSDFKLK